MNNSIEGHEILTNLIDAVKLCQTKYSNRTELATEEDDLIKRLCNLWEDILNHGFRSNKTISDFTDLFKNVQDIVSRNTVGPFTFWDFCKNHLSDHERKRFESLSNITSKDGKMRALIRSSLNEHSLQRYICTWLSDSSLKQLYEPNALMLDSEATNLLPNLANGLNTILFAIEIESPSLNDKKSKVTEEPLIYAPTPIVLIKKAEPVERNIVSFNDNFDVEDASEGLADIKTFHITEQSQNFQLNEPTLNKEFRINSIEDFNNEFKINECQNEDFLNKTYIPSEDRKNSHTSTNDISDYLKSFSDANNLVHKEYLESDTSSNESKCGSSFGVNYSHSLTSSTVISEVQKSDNEKLKTLEEQLKLMKERCTFLENRVAELSLENHRLQKLKKYIDNDFGNYNVTIPKVNLKEEKNSKHYIYEIHITSREHETWIISKRYSDFYRLHQDMLKKHNKIVKTIDFPPKKKLGNMNASFVEERRQRLQMFLRSLLRILPEVLLCTSKEELEAILPFFK